MPSPRAKPKARQKPALRVTYGTLPATVESDRAWEELSEEMARRVRERREAERKTG